MKLIIALIFIIVFLPFTAQGQTGTDFFPFIPSGDTLKIGVQEAVMMALERNPSVSIQRLVPEVSITYVSQQRATFDPTFTMTGTQTNSHGLPFLGTRPEPVDLLQSRDIYNLALNQLLPTGTNLAITSRIDRRYKSNLYKNQVTGSVSMTITQSLLQGFGFGSNLAQLRKAALDLNISKYELKAIAEEMTADVEKAYWNLYLAGQEVLIRKHSLELADKQLQESLERVAVGKLADIELAAVRAEAANRNESLIDAQSSYEKARLTFLYLLNPKEQNVISIAIDHTDKPFVPSDTLDAIDIHEQVALKYRPDLLQANLQLSKNELDVIRTRNGLLPRLNLFVTVGRNTYAEILKEWEPDLNSRFRDKSIGISFEIPVTNVEARAQARRAKISREQQSLSVTNMERLVLLDVRTSYIEVVRAARQINATRTTRELQERKLDAEMEKFRIGKSTNFLVLQAQADYIASLRDEARSMITHRNALIDLYVMEGTLLERRGIKSYSE